MKTFSLKITACDKVFYDGECQMVILPTSDGEMGILANHEQMAATIEQGQMRIQHTDCTWESVFVKDGIVEVLEKSVNLIVFFAEKPENIEFMMAREEYDQAKEEMMQKQSIQEYELSQAQMARALAKLKHSNRNDDIII